MSLPINPKLAARSLQYQKAAAEFKQLVRKPIRGADDLNSISAMLQINKHNLKYAASRKVEIAFNNLALQESVKRKVRSMSKQDFEKWVKDLLRHPQKALELPGASHAVSQIRNERAENAQSIIAFIDSVLEWSVKTAVEAGKGSSTQNQKIISNRTTFIGRTKDAATGKLIELKNKIESRKFNVDKEAALETAAVAAAVVLVIAVVAATVFTFGAFAPLLTIPVVVGTVSVAIVVNTAPSPQEVVQDATAKIEECTNKAAERRAACQSACLPGGAGDECRGFCQAIFLADAAACLLL